MRFVMLNRGKSLLSHVWIIFLTHMNGQINPNNGETNKTERKIMISLTTDEMVGLLMDWATAYTQPEWIDRLVEDMADKYASLDNQPTEEEKIDFIATIVGGIPNGFFVKDVALQFLRNYHYGEE